MLPAAHRMRRSHEFSQAMRGRRAGGAVLVIHAVAGDATRATHVGFVVNKQVGNSVIRHRVTRRLRAVMAQRLEGCGTGQLIVLRALPGAAECTSAELSHEVDKGLARMGLQ